jgi:hypothetical protein
LGIHATPDCRAANVTLAPADDGALSENWYPAIGSMLEPTMMTGRAVKTAD